MSLAPGKYWITDPCYAYPEKEWHKFCHILDGDGWYTYSGHSFFVWGTAYGDGLYSLTGPNTAATLGVDAGLLSIIPEALVEKWRSVRDMKGLMARNLVSLIEIREQADVDQSAGEGNLKFGGYTVITDGSDCEEECDGEDEAEDEEDES